MLRIIAPGFLLGTFLFHQLPVMPAPGWMLLAIPFIAWFIRRRDRISLFLFAFTLAILWSYGQSAWQLSAPLPADWYAKDILVRGFVASLPEKDARRQRFDFDVTEVLQPQAGFRPQRLRLSWYQSDKTELHPGQEWLLTVRIKPARNFANPGSFDYSGWLFQKGILYTGYVNSRAGPTLLTHAQTKYPVEQFREFISLRFRQLAGHLEFEPILRALVIGDRSDISSITWSVLQNTGTVHLMAISGLHIGLLAGFAFVITRLIWSRCARWSLFLAAPRAAAIVAMLSALGYSALAGFSLPTQRALVMLTIIMGGVVLNKKTNMFDQLALALLAVLVLDIHAVLSVSFWLSFAAITLIFYILVLRPRHNKSPRAWLDLQIGISLGLLPLTVSFFRLAPLISPLANIVAIPVVTFLIVPLAMLAMLALLVYPDSAVLLLGIADWVFGYLWQVLLWLERMPGARVTLANPGMPALLLGMTGILLLLLPAHFRFRMLGVMLLLPLLLQAPARPQLGEASLTVLDVGQGLAAVVKTKNHVLLFDTGARFSEEFDLGDAVVVPYLIQQGYSSVDQLMISHGDNDHLGGADSVIAQFPVSRLVSSIPTEIVSLPVTRCEAGMQWRWDEVELEVLYPDISDYADELRENDLSCVLQVRTRNKTMLLTGDIEAEAERRLVARYADRLRSDVLLVPHHGSKTSSTEAFVTEVSPHYALVAAGWRNRYRFPHPSVSARYNRIGSTLYITGQQGALRYDSANDRIETYRPQVARFWQIPDVD